MADYVETQELVLLRRQYAQLATVHIQPSASYKTWERVYEEFPRLMQHPGYQRIAVHLERKLLCVVTRTIFHPGEGVDVHRIGELIVLIDVGLKTMKFENPENAVGNYAHPHVGQNGQLCVTSGRDALNAMLVEGRFLDLLDQLWKMLHLTGPENYPYQRATLWPKVEKGDVL